MELLLLSGGFVAPGAMPAIPAGVLSEDVLVRYEHPQLLSKKEVRRPPPHRRPPFVVSWSSAGSWAGRGLGGRSARVRWGAVG